MAMPKLNLIQGCGGKKKVCEEEDPYDLEYESDPVDDSDPKPFSPQP